MEIEAWFYIVIFIGCIFLSAFFSGSESAFFSIQSDDIRRLKDKMDSSKNVRRVLYLLKNPRRLLMTILIGNTIINVTAATIAALFTERYIPEHLIGSSNKILIQIVFVTLIILMFSEVTPKVFAVKRSVKFSLVVSLPLLLIVKVFAPFSYIFDKTYKGFAVIFKVKKEVSFINEEELKALIQVGEEKGTIDPNEKEMINSIFEFGDTMVKEIMIPRMDMVVVDKKVSINEVIKLIYQKGHSRIPVIDENIDKISGILFVKDLLKYRNKEKKINDLSDLVRKPYYVPESKMIDKLLREFQKERIHMAIVVDEYGGTAGLITLEDVIEEIVGEIRDEYDKEQPLIRRIDEVSWIVDGKINIEELNEEIGIGITIEENYDSLGGFILNKLKKIPVAKEEIKYKNFRLIVESLFEQRITKVKIVCDSTEKGDLF